jgi:mRNA interferase RelE/StbE
VSYRIIVPPDTENPIAKLHPLLKAKIRAGLDTLSLDPKQGKPLRKKLGGFHSYRVARYRIVYQIFNQKSEIYILAVGHRKTIYQSL